MYDLGVGQTADIGKYEKLYLDIKKNNPRLFCCYCESALVGDNFKTKDHVNPKSKSKNFKKTLNCCWPCNQEKKNMFLNEYLGWLQSQIGAQNFGLLMIKIDNVKKLMKKRHC